MISVSQRLLEIRNQRGLLQKDIAKDIGISLRAYRYYETGERNPDSDTILKICQCYGIDANWLLGLSDNPESHKVGLSDEAAGNELK